jgi:hypothetical protein
MTQTNATPAARAATSGATQLPLLNPQTPTRSAAMSDRDRRYVSTDESRPHENRHDHLHNRSDAPDVSTVRGEAHCDGALVIVSAASPASVSCGEIGHSNGRGSVCDSRSFTRPPTSCGVPSTGKTNSEHGSGTDCGSFMAELTL